MFTGKCHAMKNVMTVVMIAPSVSLLGVCMYIHKCTILQCVREDDADGVEQWIAYLEVAEKNRPKHVYHKAHPWYDPYHNVALIDKVDDYDKHYNAVHNAVITNNVRLLYRLRDAGAG